MTNNIEVHRGDQAEPVTITIDKRMRDAVEAAGEGQVHALAILAENDAKAIVNALIDALPFQTLALVRMRLDRITRTAS